MALTRRETLDADLKEVLDHLNAFPGDRYAVERLEKIQYAIEAETAPMMSHQRQRAELPTLAEIAKVIKTGAPPVTQSPCRVCDHHIKCVDCVYASTPAIIERFKHTQKIGVSGKVYTEVAQDAWIVTDDLSIYHDKNVILPAPAEMHARTRKALADEEAAKPRYTFGADYEMDQRWLATERDKVAGLHPQQWSGMQPHECKAQSKPETDMFLFPSSAFCLTDMANVRYGRLG